ncbi:MAG: hypothetical protein D3916_09030, partial [Candidatus Electrothrix sp. MAN1_4]|nr:hypothetical protein [Candidatus Electrothrix sp. MAN1_4]
MTLTEESYSFMKELTASSDLNRFPEQYGGGYCFNEPFFGVSRGDDPLFEELKTIIAPDHPTPLHDHVDKGFRIISCDGVECFRKLPFM